MLRAWWFGESEKRTETDGDGQAGALRTPQITRPMISRVRLTRYHSLAHLPSL